MAYLAGRALSSATGTHFSAHFSFSISQKIFLRRLLALDAAQHNLKLRRDVGRKKVFAAILASVAENRAGGLTAAATLSKAPEPFLVEELPALVFELRRIVMLTSSPP